VLKKIDAADRPVQQIEICDRHAEPVIARERKRGFEIFDRRYSTAAIGASQTFRAPRLG
jgi:hypothetical protein